MPFHFRFVTVDIQIRIVEFRNQKSRLKQIDRIPLDHGLELGQRLPRMDVGGQPSNSRRACVKLFRLLFERVNNRGVFFGEPLSRQCDRRIVSGQTVDCLRDFSA